MGRNYRTLELSDQTLIKTLRSIAAGLVGEGAALTVQLDEQDKKPITCSLKQIDANPEIQQILESKTSLIYLVTLALQSGEFAGATIRIKREDVSDTVAINYKPYLPFSQMYLEPIPKPHVNSCD